MELLTRVLKGIKKYAIAYLFILPNFVFFFLFFLIPFVWVIWLSFHGGGVLGGYRFAGLDNYQAVSRDPIFWKAIYNTFCYLAIILAAIFTIPLAIAILLNHVSRLKGFYRAAIFFPQLSSVVVASIIWLYLLYPTVGPISMVVRLFGFTPPNWLGSPWLALPTVAAVEYWRSTGFYVLLFFAGLQNISPELYEAAMIDGANTWQKFLYITVPSLRPILLFALVMGTIWNIQLFDSVYILTKGGPGYATTTVVWYIYENAFRWNALGKGATMSFFLLILTGMLAFIQLKVIGFGREQ